MSGKYALIIGNTEYNDPGLAQLTAPGKDVEDFAGILRDPQLCAFDDVKVLLNQLSTAVIAAIDEFFDEKRPNDLLVLYYSGHGVKDEFGALYLAFQNTIRSRLRSSAIKSDYIRDAMNQSRSKRQVVILDCCNSGAFLRGTKAETGGTMGMISAFQGYGRYVLTASDEIQFAWEGDKIIGETNNSLFTHFLLRGLHGEADTNSDGKITVDELYDYTYEQISRVTPKQTPRKDASKQEGEIVLRQIARLEDIKPIALPDDLLSEIEDVRPSVREWAVQRLANILRGKNKGMARTAQAELERIAAEDDSKRVSQSAAQILDSVRQEEKRAEEQRKAHEEAERLAALRAEEERLAREKAEAERKAKEESEKLMRAQAAREAAEREAARLKAEREAAELAARQAAEKVAREKAERELAEREAAAQAEREAMEMASRKRAEREAAEKAEREAMELAARRRAERAAAEKLPLRPERTISTWLASLPSGLRWVIVLGILLSCITAAATGGMAIWSGMNDPDVTSTPLPSETPVVLAPLREPTEIPLIETPIPVSTPFGGGNGWIIFSSLRDEPEPEACDPTCNREIYVMNADGTRVVRLTNRPTSDDIRPAWSPEGKRIAFASNRDEADPESCAAECNYEIYVMNMDGSGQTRLTDNSQIDSRPAWSPDGQRIAFQSTRDGNLEIYVMNTDGSNETRLTNGPGADFKPAWSPDGKKIAFVSDRDGNAEIYMMNADGSKPTRLTENDQGDYEPTWSPDGQHIAFVSYRDEPDNENCIVCNSEIYVMNTDGSDQTRLTKRGAGDFEPAWSPDGQHIVFVSFRDETNFDPDTYWNSEIYVMNADGSEQRRLTRSGEDDSDPSWQPEVIAQQ